MINELEDSYYRFCVFDRNRITIFSDFKHSTEQLQEKIKTDDCHFGWGF